MAKLKEKIESEEVEVMADTQHSVAIRGIYDGKVVRLLEPIQLETPYRVAVTFLEPIGRDKTTRDKDNLEPFIGMWADFTPEEERVFQALLEERANYFTGREFEVDQEESAP